MQQFLEAADAARNVTALWVAFARFFQRQGISRLAAVHFPPVGAADHGRVRINMQGFPTEWRERYIAQGLQADDPITEQAVGRSRPFLWSEVREMPDLTTAQRDFMQEFSNVHPGDGIAIPVFGPNGRNGYVGLGLNGPADELDDATLHGFRLVAQYAHQRYCELITRDYTDRPLLSPRETEVLQWVARGKSNSVIADIIGVRASTVDTHLRRIYGKLEVSDRVSAALAGLGHGFIRAA